MSNLDSIEILYQDDHYLAVHKPSGLLVHRSSECADRDNLMKQVKKQTGLFLHPLNRLDRPVSGIVLFALSSDATRALQEIWGTGSVTKEYHCLVRRHLFEPGHFDYELSDDSGVKRQALTRYWPLQRFANTTLLRVEIDTGRRHQIRRHFARCCHNLVGDTMYGKGVTNNFFRDHFNLHRIFLHASRLQFRHPFTEEIVTIECPLPPLLEDVIAKLSNRLDYDLIQEATRLLLKNDDTQESLDGQKEEMGAPLSE